MECWVSCREKKNDIVTDVLFWLSSSACCQNMFIERPLSSRDDDKIQHQKPTAPGPGLVPFWQTEWKVYVFVGISHNHGAYRTSHRFHQGESDFRMESINVLVHI